METRSYNLLIVSPEAAGSDLSLQIQLVDTGLPNLSTYSSSSDETTRALLDLGGLDAVVYRLLEPERDFPTLRMIRETAPGVALIVVARTRDRSLDSRVREAGAQDCLFEDELSPGLLQRSVQYAVEHRRLEVTLDRLKSYDLSTGLLNQTAFLALLERCLGRARRGSAPFALVILKVPELEECFRRFDRRLGEEALSRVVRRVRRAARPGDLLAVLEGQELALLLPAVDRLDKAHVAGRRLARTLQRPLELGHQRLEPTVRWAFSLFNPALRGAREMLETAVVELRSKASRPPAAA